MHAYLLVFVIYIGVVVAGAPAAYAQSADVVKAAFVIGFSDMVSWPSTPDSYTIGIEGDGSVADALQKLSPLIKNKTIHIKEISGDDASGCQIVYIPSGGRVTIKPGVLTVGEGEDFLANGGIIGFVLRDGKVRFIINKNAAEQAGIKISPRLLSMAAL